MTEDLKQNDLRNNFPGDPSDGSIKSVQLPLEEKLIVSSSPHIHETLNIRKIMLLVILSLAPGCLAGIWYFGISALLVLLYCMVFCVAVESLWCFIAGKSQKTLGDCSAIVTGLILGMNLSPGVPWWLCLIGAGIGIVLGKQIYGGIGHNPFNPAIVARVGLLIAFPKLMTTWYPSRFMTADPSLQETIFYNENLINKAGMAVDALKGKVMPFFSMSCDAVTCATPLSIAKEAARTAAKQHDTVFSGIVNSSKYWDYFWGNMGGCIGETSVFALLIGGAVLMATKLIRWQVPVSFVGSVALLTWLVHTVNPSMTPPPLFHVMTGGLILGAFFCATDMVTSPMTGLGSFIFGAGCGIITFLIRVWGNYPEGVSFAILFMNALVPLIDRLTYKRPFGYNKPQPAGETK